ncbi:hypothetical protein CTAYLR_005395 [Chrysophaeum taylorii]|uniref:Uncharacterized protein n=1 Tax=Chrysophaeum taylorii TaxID=2483200 RepID=A0AAD7U9S2_9STRA|nr:hypothetical protein CTAYLR_005395 [Chrysophaeum taylorii]
MPPGRVPARRNKVEALVPLDEVQDEPWVAPAVTEKDPWGISVRVIPEATAHAVWAAFLTFAGHRFEALGRRVLKSYFGGVGTLIHGLLGGVLGLLLAFRTNQAYGRYWRATESFGNLRDALVAAARKAAYLNDSDNAFDRRLYRAIVRHAIALPVAVAQGLKDAEEASAFESILTATEIDEMVQAHDLFAVPYSHSLFAALGVLGRPIRASDDGRGGRLALWSTIDAHLADAAHACGVLDTIKTSSPPRSYALHVRRFLLLWLATLPAALLCSWPSEYCFHPITAGFVAGTCAWALYATDELAHLVGQPFQRFKNKHPHQTTFPLDSWANHIVATLRHHVIAQSVLERRIRSRSWVVTLESCIQPPLDPVAPHNDNKTPLFESAYPALYKRPKANLTDDGDRETDDDDDDDDDDDVPVTPDIV